MSLHFSLEVVCCLSWLSAVIRCLSYYACCSAAPAPGGRQQPRPRRTQRRVTHNEKRYHSGTPLSIPPAYRFCTVLTSYRNIWKQSLLTFNERTTWRRHHHANWWTPLSSLCVFFIWFIAVGVNDTTELSEVNTRKKRIGNEREIKHTGWVCCVFRHSCLAVGWLISVSWLCSYYFPEK